MQTTRTLEIDPVIIISSFNTFLLDFIRTRQKKKKTNFHNISASVYSIYRLDNCTYRIFQKLTTQSFESRNF